MLYVGLGLAVLVYELVVLKISDGLIRLIRAREAQPPAAHQERAAVNDLYPNVIPLRALNENGHGLGPVA